MSRRKLITYVKNEFIGGVSVAFVALPLALSFGVLSGMGAAAGIYGAIFTGIIASIFGGTKAQISGPTGAMTVVLVDLFGEHGLEALVAAMILAGLLQILMAFLKLGKYIKLIPKPTIIGFTNGIGILIFLKQLDYLRADSFLALASLFLMLFLPFLHKKIPTAIFALVGGSLLAKFFLPTDLVVGEIELLVPSLAIPNFLSLDLLAVSKAAVILALLGAIESLLSALIVDDLIDEKHDSDRELFGQGLANFIAALFGNLIGTGAIVRTAVNVDNGGRGRLSGIIHSLVLLLLVVQFGSFAKNIPLAVLGGVLMGTALNMIEYEESYRLSKASKEAGLVICLTSFLTVFTDLTFAVFVGTLASGFLLLVNLGDSYLKEYKINCQDLDKMIKSFTIEGALFFGVTDNISNSLEKKVQDADIIILNLMNLSVIDASGMVFLGDIKEYLEKNQKRLILTGLKEETYQKLCEMGILDGQEAEINLGRIKDALVYAENLSLRKSNLEVSKKWSFS